MINSTNIVNSIRLKTYFQQAQHAAQTRLPDCRVSRLIGWCDLTLRCSLLLPGLLVILSPVTINSNAEIETRIYEFFIRAHSVKETAKKQPKIDYRQYYFV